MDAAKPRTRAFPSSASGRHPPFEVYPVGVDDASRQQLEGERRGVVVSWSCHEKKNEKAAAVGSSVVVVVNNILVTLYT